MKPSVHLIRPENFEEQVILGKVPFLLLCMPHNEGFSKQLEVIEAIAEKYQKELKVGVLAEESIELFKKRLRIIGSPTFLLLAEGIEVNRILGVVGKKTLTDLIDKHLSAYR
jgi:thioredoxin-like negative regulator of GroEL